MAPGRTRMCAHKLVAILSLVLLGFVATARPAAGLHFYLEGSEQKCFLEELPKETTIEGAYKTEEWSDQQNRYMEHPGSGLQIIVTELATGHKLLNQKGSFAGTFTFTTQEAGEQSICLQSNASGWFHSVRTKVTLDIQIKDYHSQNTGDAHKEIVNDLAYKVREMNARIQTVRREQQYQREREAEFRDLSETINSKVVWWTITQVIVVGITGLWQMRHLRHFFQTKKLV